MSEYERRIDERLGRVERLLIAIVKGESRIMSQVDDLKAALAAEGTDLDALTAAVTSIETKLANVQNAPDLSDEIAQIKTFDAAIKAATASTEPAPAPAPEPAPPADGTGT